MRYIRLSAVLLLLACDTPTTIPVAISISISPAELSFNGIGQTASVVATAKDQNGAAMGAARIEWMTTDESVASISSEGPVSSIVVTSVGTGTATIVASSNLVAASAGVTVVQEVASIELSDTVLSFSALGDTTQLTVTVKDANDSVIASPMVSWTTSDSTVATISNAGLASSIANGKAVITATVGFLSETTAVDVAQVAANVELSDTVLSFASLGDTTRLTAAVKDENGYVMSGVSVSWDTSAPSIATVSSEGLVTAVSNGSATITVGSDSASNTVDASVEQIPMSLTLSPDSLVFAVPGDTATIITTVKDAGGSEIVGAAVSFTSSDVFSVSVNSSGMLTGVASGPAAIIRAKSGNVETDILARVKGGYLMVTVVGDDDPLSGVMVWLTDPNGELENQSTDSFGQALFRDLTVGQHIVTLQQLPAELIITNPQNIQVGDDEGVELPFSGRFAPAQVTGTAKPWGKPVTNALVRVEGRDTVEVIVGSTGIFQVDSVLRGTYTLTISNYTGVKFKETTLTRGLNPGQNTVEFLGKQNTSWESLTSGRNHTCGVMIGGDAYCWGRNESGRLGDGSIVDRNEPILISGGLTWTSVSAGYYHTCGVTTAGDAYCWGRNEFGRLGDGTTTDRYTPTLVSGGLTWGSLTSGYLHTCGVTTAGDAYCWGGNQWGQVGDGSTTNDYTPTLVSGGLTWTSLTRGSQHTCGVTTAGDAYCWGYNGDGQLGDGTTTDRYTPTLVSGEHSWSSINGGIGTYHTCGVTTMGEAYCWGGGSYGRLGTGLTSNHSSPVLVSGGLTWGSISPGRDHTCGVTTGGDTYCWGEGADGKLGNARDTNRYAPVLVSGGLTWGSVTTGRFHACGVLKLIGVGYCWGSNPYGELGDQTNTSSFIPVKVGGNW